MTRERISRPNSSAPRRNFSPGRARFSMRLCLAGSAGASHGAPAAATASTITTTSPVSAKRFRRKRTQVSADSVAGAFVCILYERWPLALPRDARVQRAVGEVHREIDEDESEGEHEHGALQEHVVAGEDRLDHQPPEARPRKDRFREDGAPHELAGLEAEQGEDGNGRIAERVLG